MHTLADAATPATDSGLSLRAHLEQEESLFLETGHLFGLSELPLKERDPVGFELTFDALSSSTMMAFNTANSISFSPFLREGWDGIFGLMTPTGATVCTSVGVVTHTLLAGEGLKWALREGVEEDPGIEPGDIFEQNSTHISAMHANDAFTYLPIFDGDELVGWAFGMVHRWDAGQFIYGPMSITADNRYAEGEQFFFEKVGRDNLMSAEYKRRIKHTNRLPHLWMSDASACVAGGMVIREAAEQIIAARGAEYFTAICEEFIEDARRKAVGRIKAQMIPGRYRKRVQRALFLADKQTLFEKQRKDWLRLLPTEVVIDGAGELHWSYEGATCSVPLGQNLGPGGLLSTVSTAAAAGISFERNNTGSLSVHHIAPAPDGSWANPLPSKPDTYCNNWPLVLDLHIQAEELLCRSFFARGYWEEALAGGPGIAHNEFEGTAADGSPFFGQLMDGVGTGLPGQPLRDGPDCAGNPGVPITDTGNAEIWEDYTPLVWLGRRLDTDGCGKGKYRGGVNLNPAYLILYAAGTYQRQDNGAHGHIPGNDGIFGAYPGPIGTGLRIDGEEMKRRIDAGEPLPHGRGGPVEPEYERVGIEADKVVLESAPNPVPQVMEEYTLLESSGGGAPGVGDPLERDPELVCRDLDDEIVTPWAAREIWGVVVREDESAGRWVTDRAATDALRAEMRRKRAERSVPFREWWSAEREKVLDKQMQPCVVEMLRSAMELSDEYAREVREFWQLPPDHEF